jgi:hypothetical protein
LITANEAKRTLVQGHRDSFAAHAREIQAENIPDYLRF